jgi:hypothetical protein
MTLARNILFSFAIAALPALAGCSAKSTTPSVPAAPSFVYYTTNTLGSPQMGIVAYPITATSTLATTLNASAANGLALSRNMAFDASGRLFVVNNQAPFTISVFTPPLTGTSAASFILTMPAGTTCIFGIAFDSSGNLWISNCSTSIFEFNGPFTMSETLPAANVTLTSSPITSGLAFDASGNLWVSLDIPSGGGIEEYLKGTGFTNATPVDHTITGLKFPVALAFDKSGDLFSSGAGQGTAEYFASNLASGATPNWLSPTGLVSTFVAVQFTFDTFGNLYVADCGLTPKIYVYPTATQAFSILLSPVAYSDANIVASGCVFGIAIR